jgi:hypothetical protein
MSARPLQILWVVAGLLVVVAGWRAVRLPDPYRPGQPLGVIEDRREYHFRDLGYAETQRLLQQLLGSAARASDPRARALELARIAALQHERGLSEPAEAAARDALRLAPDDPEVRRILASPLDLRTLARPSRSTR